MEKKTTWSKGRLAVDTWLAGLVLIPYCRWKYGLTVVPFPDGKKHPYLILLNHQTPFDQFFVGMSFDGPVYYMATEDIFSIGWVSSLIRWLVAPIPIKKGTTDAQSVKNCIRVAREGGTIAIAPEGNRTYSGKTEYMNPTIAALAKKLGLPIALFKIEGGYGVQPRWSDVVRKGSMSAYVSQVIEPQEYQSMTTGELFSRIQEGLYVNEARADREFYHPRRAEYLERMAYVCPYCGLSKFESRREVIECMSCHRKVVYEPSTRLTGVGFDFPFAFVNDWYEYQQDFVRKLDLGQYLEVPMFQDTARVSEVIVKKRKRLLRKAACIRLYGDRILLDDDMALQFEDVYAAAVMGRNKLNIYHRDMIYQFKGSKRFNAMKYVNIFYHYKNTKKGDGNGEFLGL